MSMKQSFLVCVSVLALCVTAEAKTTTLARGDKGILGAMRRMGCRDPNWFPEVLRRSGILESQLSNLREGTPIVVPDECENGSPAREDTKITRQIFAAQSALQNTREVAKANEVLASDLKTAHTTIFQLGLVIDKCKQEIADLTRQVDRLKNENGWANKRALLSLVALILVIGMFLVSALWFLFPAKQIKKIQKDLQELLASVEKKPRSSQQTGPPLLPVRGSSAPTAFHGVEYLFLDHVDHWVTCPVSGCGKRLAPNAGSKSAHLLEHTHLRLEWISPEEARRNIAIAANGDPLTPSA
jgi:hypothetical protein